MNPLQAIAFFGADMFIADNGNHVIRLLESTTGLVSTYAGAFGQYSPFANGPYSSARFNNPTSIAIDPSGQVGPLCSYPLCLFSASGFISFSCGTPTSCFAWHRPWPFNLQIFVADWGNAMIRVLSGGNVTTLAGTGTAGLANGQSASAQFNRPQVSVCLSGILYQEVRPTAAESVDLVIHC